MRRAAAAAGLVVLCGAWIVAAGHNGMTGHMIAHMAAVAVAAPLLAYGIAAGRFDPAAQWPRLVSPLPMSLLELGVVWGWHAPAARALAAHGGAALALEQAMFLAAGVLLWSACVGAAGAASAGRRAIGVIALLLTTMHMTLLGALITLAPRPLFGTTGSRWLGVSLAPLEDQQMGGVVMLLVGGGSYLIGGITLAARLLKGEGAPAPASWK